MWKPESLEWALTVNWELVNTLVRELLANLPATSPAGQAPPNWPASRAARPAPRRTRCRPPPPSPTPTCRDARPTPTHAPAPAAATAAPPPPAGHEPHPRPLRWLPTEPGRRRQAELRQPRRATAQQVPPGSHRQPARFRLAVRLRGDRLETQPLHVPSRTASPHGPRQTASHKSPPSSRTRTRSPTVGVCPLSRATSCRYATPS